MQLNQTKNQLQTATMQATRQNGHSVVSNKDPEKDVMRRKIKDLESENRSLRVKLNQAGSTFNKTATQTRTLRPSTAQVQGKGFATGGTESADNAPIGKVRSRVLTLKQLTDLIQDMYTQKVKFDKKCQDNKLSRETVEQYMYTYLNQKYGLKSLIVEWVDSIIKAVRTYIREEHDVELFAKILKNECDEDFRFIQMHVKETLISLVKVMLKDKNPLKGEKEIQNMLERVQNGVIDDWMWMKILEKMYEEKDAQVLQERIKETIQLRS